MFVFGGYIDMRGASDELWQYELGKCHSKNDAGQHRVYFKHRRITNSANVAHGANRFVVGLLQTARSWATNLNHYWKSLPLQSNSKVVYEYFKYFGPLHEYSPSKIFKGVYNRSSTYFC